MNVVIFIILFCISCLLYGLLNYLLMHRVYITGTRDLASKKRIRRRLYDGIEIQVDGARFYIYSEDSAGRRWRCKSESGEKCLLLVDKNVTVDGVCFRITDNDRIRAVVERYFHLLTLILILLPVAFGLLLGLRQSIDTDTLAYSSIQRDSEQLNVEQGWEYYEDSNQREKQEIQKADNAEATESNRDEVDEGNTILPTVCAIHVDGLTQNLSALGETRQVNKTTVFTVRDSETGGTKTLYADKLIERKICMWYDGSKDTTYIFVGQYNDDYQWNDDCLICAYRDGKLFYTTIDLYDNGKLLSYTRVSINPRDRDDPDDDVWAYTERTVVDAHTTDGDTWNYSYGDIAAKDFDKDNLKEEDAYTPEEIRERVSVQIDSHYHGKNVDDNPLDDSSDAYLIHYKDNTVSEIYKGSMVINNHYGNGWAVREIEEDTYWFMKGTFYSENGEKINDLKEEAIDQDETIKKLQGQPFWNEVKKYFETV